MLSGNIAGEFHKFICIQGSDSGYILTAYHEKYCLRSIKVPNVIDTIKILLKGDDQSLLFYNDIFRQILMKFEKIFLLISNLDYLQNYLSNI